MENINITKEFEIFNGHSSINLQKNYALVEIETYSKENVIVTVISSSLSQSQQSYLDIYSYQLIHLSESTFQQVNLIQNSSVDYRILINNTEGEGNICFNEICDNNNNYIHLNGQKIYSFSISNKTNFFIKANKPLDYNIKIIYEISNKVIKELNYEYNFENINPSKDSFPLLYFIKDVKYNGININFNFKFNNSNDNNLIIKGYGLNYTQISSNKDKNDIRNLYLANEIQGKYDNITNSGMIELSNEFMKTNNKFIDDKYFMIMKESTHFIFENLRNDIYAISKDENKILLPINKYIRYSFHLIGNNNISQNYFFEKDNITNNTFILEFSSNYENIELNFSNIIKSDSPKIIGGFKQYNLSIISENSNDYFFNVVIMPTNDLKLENNLKEVNIMIKYYNKEKKINLDNIYNKTIKLKK